MENTKKSKDRYYNYLCEYIKNVELDTRAIQDIEDEALGNFFSRYLFWMRINKKIKLGNGETEEIEMWPKQNTAEYAKSMIKTAFFEKHGIDFSDPFRFPDVKKKWDSLCQKIKSESNTVISSNCSFRHRPELKKKQKKTV